MPVHAVTGKLGAGKTLVAVGKIKEYLIQGRKVATNLDLKLENLVGIRPKKTVVFRLSDIPTVSDFKTIGLGYEGDFQGDHKNGLVVLDECALWLNSRAWSDKTRKPLIDYFVHLRKKRWDLILIIQDKDALDKQFRDLYCEHIVYCSRSDRFNIPVIGWFIRQLGAKAKLPRMHIGHVFYVIGGKENPVESWYYRGSDLMSSYDTEQSFNESDSPSIYSYLPPHTIAGRYVSKKQQFKAALKNISFGHFFLLGLLFGAVTLNAMQPDYTNPETGMFTCNDAWKALFGSCDIQKKDVDTMLKNYLSGESVTVSDLSDSVTLESDKKFDASKIYITGSVGVGDSYTYTFSYDGEPIEPYDIGFRVYDNTECHAVILNVSDHSERFDIRCTK